MEQYWERSLPFINIDLQKANKLFKHAQLNENVVSLSAIKNGCRSSNYILKTNLNNTYVLKIFPKDNFYYEREEKLLNLLKNYILVQNVYSISKGFCINNKTFGIYEYMNGENLGIKIRDGYKISRNLIKELAIILAKIHTIKYNEYGILDENLKIIHKSEPLCTLYKENMGINFKNRLGNEVVTKINTIVSQNKEILLNLDKNISLIHGDFQGTNILIDNNRVSGIIDWEFVMAGNPLIDIGKLFRYEKYFHNDLIKVFEEEYNRYSKIKLIDQWYKIAKLVDLISVIKLINTKEEMPNKHKDIKEIIFNTIKQFL